MDKMQEIDEMQETVLQALGPEEAYNAVCRALSYDDKRELFDFLYRMYDLAPDEESTSN